jgi:hypothetical protein
MKRILFFSLLLGGSVLSGQTSTLDDEIEARFKMLHAQTTTIANSVFGVETADSWNKPSAYVTNRLIGTTVNYALERASISISFMFPNQSVKKPDPVIVKVKPIEVQCNFCRQCSECKLLDCDLGCYAERAACMTTAWPAISACETIKQASRLADGAKILEVDFQDLELAADASSSAVRVQFDGTLNPTLSLQNLSVKATMKGQTTVQFEDVPGILTACFPVAQPLTIPPTQVSVTSNQFDAPSTLDRAVDGDKLNLTLKINELKPQMQIDGNPFWDILKANPLFTGTCVIPANIMAWTGLVQLLFPISLDMKLEGRNVPISVTAISVPLADVTYSVKVKSTATSLGVVAEHTRAPQ